MSIGDVVKSHISQIEFERDQLEGYVRWAATQRLGSVFEAAYDSGGVLVARKVADSIPVVKVPIPE